MKSVQTFKSKVWKYPGMAAWRFLSLPTVLAAEIKQAYGRRTRGWGSLPVTVTIGKTSWETSIFPDKKRQTYLLPLKAVVRKKEGIEDEDQVSVKLKLRLASPKLKK